MPIFPLPQFEADLEEDRKIYESLKSPTSIVVRFGAMKMVGEFPYSGDAKPGCGSKFVVRTHRGTELAEMLTSTCPNAGCSKSVTRKEMLEYVENSGGKDYPFFTQGKVIRLATVEDLNRQIQLDEMKPQMVRMARAIVARLGLDAKIVDAEPILGEERLTFHFLSEERIDFRDLVNELAAHYQTRIEMHQVGSRDESRLVADYEKCGQHCCCKQFLKVLKPVSMKQAKIQKATLDPLKISGRCGRLMCCLRYEESTYDDLRARLPKRKTRVKTTDGWGLVLDSQILTQLVLVELDSNRERIAVAIEDLINDGSTPPPLPTFGPPPEGARPDTRVRPGPTRPGPTGSSGGPPLASPPRNDRARSGPAPTRGPDRPQAPAGANDERASSSDASMSEAEALEREIETDTGMGDGGAGARGPGGGGPDTAGGGPRGKRRRNRGGRREGGGSGGGNGGAQDLSRPGIVPPGTNAGGEQSRQRPPAPRERPNAQGPEASGPGGPGDAGGSGAGGDQPRKRRRRRGRNRGGPGGSTGGSGAGGSGEGGGGSGGGGSGGGEGPSA